MKKTVLLIFALCIMLGSLAACSPVKQNLERSPNSDKRELGEISMIVRDETVGPQAETVTLVIQNLSGNTFEYGAPYEIEKQIDGVWYSYPPEEDIGFIMILYMLEPNTTAEETIILYSFYGRLEPGKYRVVKSFSAEDGTEGVAFAAFAVK